MRLTSKTVKPNNTRVTSDFKRMIFHRKSNYFLQANWEGLNSRSTWESRKTIAKYDHFQPLKSSNQKLVHRELNAVQIYKTERKKRPISTKCSFKSSSQFFNQKIWKAEKGEEHHHHSDGIFQQSSTYVGYPVSKHLTYIQPR